VDAYLFSQYLLSGIVIGLIYSLMALGITFIYSIMKMINWAMGEFYMIGSYVQYALLVTLLPPERWYLALPLAMGPVFLLGVVTQRLLLRPMYVGGIERRDEYATIITIALMVFFRNLAIVLGGPNQYAPKDYARATTLGTLPISGNRVVALVAAIVLLTLFSLMVKQTWLGRAFRGAAQNRVGIQTAGIDVLRLDMLAFGVGVALAAAAGALLAPDFLVYPENGSISTFKGFEIIVIGGLGSIPGSVVGGVLLGVIEALGSVFIASEASHRDHEEREQHHPDLAPAPEELGEDLDEDRAQDRSEEGPQTADDHHDDDGGHLVKLHGRGRQEPDVVPLEAAGDGGEDGGDDEGHALPLECVHPHGGRRLLVVPDRAHEHPDPGMDDLPRGERGGEGEAEEEVVVRRRPRRPEEERRPQAQVTARDLVLDGDEEPDRLGEGPRRQREVDRPHAEAQAAQDVAEPRREHGAGDDPHEHGHARVLDQQRRGVGADAGEGVVRERELAGIAGEQVPAHGEHDVVEADGEDVGVVLRGDPGNPRDGGVCQEAPADAAGEGLHPAQAPRRESRMIWRSWSAKCPRGPSRRTCPPSIM